MWSPGGGWSLGVFKSICWMGGGPSAGPDHTAVTGHGDGCRFHVFCHFLSPSVSRACFCLSFVCLCLFLSVFVCFVYFTVCFCLFLVGEAGVGNEGYVTSIESKNIIL